MGSQLLWSQHLPSHYTKGQLLMCVLSALIRHQVPGGGGTRASTPAPKISLRTSSDFAADPKAGLIELLCTSRYSDLTGLEKREPGPRLATQMPRYVRLPWSHSFRPAVRIPLRRVQYWSRNYLHRARSAVTLLFTTRRSRTALPPRPQQMVCVCVCVRFGNRYVIFQHYWEREDCVTLPE